MSKERPILFSGPMVRAILEGRKTQTRRVVKLPSGKTFSGFVNPEGLPIIDNQLSNFNGRSQIVRPEVFSEKCPCGTVGDRLWVRETWQQTRVRKSDGQRFCLRNPKQGCGDLHYAADHTGEEPPRWRPSIHMPRWASRLTLEITGVRVERLQEISEEDVAAEGTPGMICGRYQCRTCNGQGHTLVAVYCEDCNGKGDNPVEHWKTLWQSINGPKSWAANPWVWVIEFKRIDGTTAGTAGTTGTTSP